MHSAFSYCKTVVGTNSIDLIQVPKITTVFPFIIKLIMVEGFLIVKANISNKQEIATFTLPFKKQNESSD